MSAPELQAFEESARRLMPLLCLTSAMVTKAVVPRRLFPGLSYSRFASGSDVGLGAGR